MDTFDDAKIERMHAMEQGMKSLMKTTIWLGGGVECDRTDGAEQLQNSQEQGLFWRCNHISHITFEGD